MAAETYSSWLEFSADAGPGEQKARLLEFADLLYDHLPRHGFRVIGIDNENDEDWNWVELANIGPFVVKIGLAIHPAHDGRFLAELYPPLPFVRMWFRKRSTTELIRELGTSVWVTLESVGKCRDLHWVNQPPRAAS